MHSLFVGSAQPTICSETFLLSGTRIKQTQSTSKMYFFLYVLALFIKCVLRKMLYILLFFSVKIGSFLSYTD